MTAVLNFDSNEPSFHIVDVEQGSQEWLHLRKTKITATDACVIMGASPWKTKIQLYKEKTTDQPPMIPNERMRRGTELEPMARSLFNIQTDTFMTPKVVVKDWAMASLDGMNMFFDKIVEIKCPGDKDHALALQGKVPDHYYPQLQHQMWVTGLNSCYYYSFDGVDGVTVEVKRDNKYIEKMIIEEKKFYDCIQSETPPEASEDDYVERNDSLWSHYASQWKQLTQQIKDLENQQEEVRKHLIFLSGESNSKGAGISLCQVQRKGNVDYSKIPELKTVDLDNYRKKDINVWRLTSN